MWSADQVLGPVGHRHRYIMVYLPTIRDLMLGTNIRPGKPSPSAIGDDAGTPFAVGAIPVDDELPEGTAITDSERAFWGRFLCWRLLPSMMVLLRIVTHESGT